MAHHDRPVYLNLLAIRLPMTAVVSILHRVTGVLLVLLVFPALYLLELSLSDPEVFMAQTAWWRGFPGQLAGVVLVWIVASHTVSGIRHLLLDVDIGISRNQARVGAWLSLALPIAVAGIAGFCFP